MKEELDDIRKTLGQIKNALLGQNLEGGLIKKVNDNCSEIKSIKSFCKRVQNEKKEEKKQDVEVSIKYKLAIVGLAASALTQLLMWGLSLVVH